MCVSVWLIVCVCVCSAYVAIWCQLTCLFSLWVCRHREAASGSYKAMTGITQNPWPLGLGDFVSHGEHFTGYFCMGRKLSQIFGEPNCPAVGSDPLTNLCTSPAPRPWAEAYPWSPEATCELTSYSGQWHARSDGRHSQWMHLTVSPSFPPTITAGDLPDSRSSISLSEDKHGAGSRQTQETNLADDSWDLGATGHCLTNCCAKSFHSPHGFKHPLSTGDSMLCHPGTHLTPEVGTRLFFFFFWLYLFQLINSSLPRALSWAPFSSLSTPSRSVINPTSGLGNTVSAMVFSKAWLTPVHFIPGWCLHYSGLSQLNRNIVPASWITLLNWTIVPNIKEILEKVNTQFIKR